MVYINIPESLQGEVMNHCFNFIKDPKEAVAVKAFSLTVLENVSRQYPEILPEIKLIIDAMWEQETAAFRSRAKNFASKINGQRTEKKIELLLLNFFE